MKNETYALRLLTPCFNGGATPRQTAELRVPSIRGQIRWWYRLACPQGDEQRLFGGVRGQAVRSSVIFRISEPSSSQQSAPMLPHKGERGGSRPALAPVDFDLLCRCREDTFVEVDRAVKIWVLLGGLGARCNRAAGSVWFQNEAPDSKEALHETLTALKLPAQWQICIAKVDSFPDGRRIASDTVDGRSDLLGGIKPKRIPSPIKFKMIELSAEPHLLMFSPKPGLWDQALDHLQNHRNASPKPLTQLDWQTL